MNAEVNIDNLIDYKTEYSRVIKKAHITGDQMTGCCPFHEDRSSSFSVNLKTGMWHCFTEDIGGNYLDFYARMNGIDTKEAYKQILEQNGYSEEDQQEQERRAKCYSVAQYAFETS